jgi:hypothetical protein
MLSGDYEAWFQLSHEALGLIDIDEPDRTEHVRTWEAQVCLQKAMTEFDSGGAPDLYDRAVGLWPQGRSEYPMFDIVASTLALVEGNPGKVLEATTVGPLELNNTHILAFGVKVMNKSIALSLLDRHAEAVELAAHLPSHGVASEMPNATVVIQMAFVYHRAGDTQTALDLTRQPSRLSVGRGLDAWCFGRTLLLAETVIDTDPDLAARLVGCEFMQALTLGYRRRSLLERLRARHGPALDNLLAEGKRLGEEAVVGQAHEQLRALGLTP